MPDPFVRPGAKVIWSALSEEDFLDLGVAWEDAYKARRTPSADPTISEETEVLPEPEGPQVVDPEPEPEATPDAQVEVPEPNVSTGPDKPLY